PAQAARLPVALHGQLALEHGEALDHRRMAVLADNARPNEGGHLVDRAALGVLPRKLENREALPVHRVLPNLADLDRCEVRRAVRVGVRQRFLLCDRSTNATTVTNPRSTSDSSVRR